MAPGDIADAAPSQYPPEDGVLELQSCGTDRVRLLSADEKVLTIHKSQSVLYVYGTPISRSHRCFVLFCYRRWQELILIKLVVGFLAKRASEYCM